MKNFKFSLAAGLFMAIAILSLAFTKVDLFRDNKLIPSLINTSLFSSVAPCSGSSLVGGRVFDDPQYDGGFSMDTLGYAGIIVYIYEDDGSGSSVLIDTANTASDGKYSFSNSGSGGPYRVQFEIPDSLNLMPSFHGINSQTTVQEIPTFSCQVNLAVAKAGDYCQTNPPMATSCFVAGDPTQGGTSAFGDVLVTFPYNSSGTASPSHLAFNSEIGPTWGLAYQRATQSIYAAAVMKRHSGFAGLGIGGIYKVDVSTLGTPVITHWLDVNTLATVDVGTDPRPANSLPASSTSSSADAVAFDAVGKIGLGDMDISEDENSLYVMNLNNNGELLHINISDQTLIAKYPITNPGCGNAGDVRPWAVDVHDGEVYIGLICSGQLAGTGDLQYFVMKLEGGVFVEVSNESLDYSKGLFMPHMQTHRYYVLIGNAGQIILIRYTWPAHQEQDRGIVDHSRCYQISNLIWMDR